MPSEWYVYVVECADDSLYTGITTDPERRVREHNESTAGARYTRSRRPVEPVAVWPCADRSQAARQEAAFKDLDRSEKLRRVRVGTSFESFRAFQREYLRVFGCGDADAGDCRPLSLVADADEAVEGAQQVVEATEAVRERWREVLPAAFPVEPASVDPLFFVGPGLFDGHAALVDGEPTLFFDMRLVQLHLEVDGFAPRVHAAHEATHALHYGATPSMYPGRPKGPREAVWHRLVAEGLATRLSEQWTDCEPADSLWFGMVEDEIYEVWREEAEQRRAELWSAVERADGELCRQSDVWVRLFRVPEELATGRLGYVYGRQIVERAEAEHSVAELLTLEPEAWWPYVASYFEERC